MDSDLSHAWKEFINTNNADNVGVERPRTPVTDVTASPEYEGTAFTCLPAEIRLMVYDLVLQHGPSHHCFYTSSIASQPATTSARSSHRRHSMLFVNRQVSSEYRQTWYQRTIFFFYLDRNNRFSRNWWNLPPLLLCDIRSCTIVVDYTYDITEEETKYLKLEQIKSPNPSALRMFVIKLYRFLSLLSKLRTITFVFNIYHEEYGKVAPTALPTVPVALPTVAENIFKYYSPRIRELPCLQHCACQVITVSTDHTLYTHKTNSSWTESPPPDHPEYRGHPSFYALMQRTKHSDHWPTSQSVLMQRQLLMQRIMKSRQAHLTPEPGTDFTARPTPPLLARQMVATQQQQQQIMAMRRAQLMARQAHTPRPGMCSAVPDLPRASPPMSCYLIPPPTHTSHQTPRPLPDSNP